MAKQTIQQFAEVLKEKYAKQGPLKNGLDISDIRALSGVLDYKNDEIIAALEESLKKESPQRKLYNLTGGPITDPDNPKKIVKYFLDKMRDLIKIDNKFSAMGKSGLFSKDEIKINDLNGLNNEIDEETLKYAAHVQYVAGKGKVTSSPFAVDDYQFIYGTIAMAHESMLKRVYGFHSTLVENDAKIALLKEVCANLKKLKVGSELDRFKEHIQIGSFEKAPNTRDKSPYLNIDYMIDFVKKVKDGKDIKSDLIEWDKILFKESLGTDFSCASLDSLLRKLNDIKHEIETEVKKLYEDKALELASLYPIKEKIKTVEELIKRREDSIGYSRCFDNKAISNEYTKTKEFDDALKACNEERSFYAAQDVYVSAAIAIYKFVVKKEKGDKISKHEIDQARGQLSIFQEGKLPDNNYFDLNTMLADIIKINKLDEQYGIKDLDDFVLNWGKFTSSVIKKPDQKTSSNQENVDLPPSNETNTNQQTNQSKTKEKQKEKKINNTQQIKTQEDNNSGKKQQVVDMVTNVDPNSKQDTVIIDISNKYSMKEKDAQDILDELSEKLALISSSDPKDIAKILKGFESDNRLDKKFREKLNEILPKIDSSKISGLESTVFEKNVKKGAAAAGTVSVVCAGGTATIAMSGTVASSIASTSSVGANLVNAISSVKTLCINNPAITGVVVLVWASIIAAAFGLSHRNEANKNKSNANKYKAEVAREILR